MGAYAYNDARATQKGSYRMKKIKGKIAALLAATLICSCAFSAVPAASASDEEESTGETVTLFSTSFEQDDTAPITDQTETGKLNNVGVAMGNPTLSEDFTSLVDINSVTGSADFSSEEAKVKLFDNDTATKWLNNGQISTPPVTVSFRITESKVVTSYIVASANDEDSRDPKAWNFYGSTDGTTWQKLDSQSDVVFSSRYEAQLFSFTNTTAYSYYKLEITQNNGNSGMTQLSELNIGNMDQSYYDELQNNAPLGIEVGTGPSATWCNTANDGWTGAQALTVTGRNINDGSAECSSVLYKDVNITVDENTNLSYVIFPSFYVENSEGYDFEYLNMHFVIDLAFTDGTYLSDLGAVDQNGVEMTPEAQADGKCLYTMQWNQVESNIGAVANGKTIDRIIVNYSDDNVTGGNSFRAFFDDIKIESKTVAVSDHLSDYVNILRGTNSTTAFSRGLTSPIVAVPHGFNFFVPVTNPGSNQPYFYQTSDSKNTISHITVSHVPSTWVGDWGTWQFMANTSVSLDDANTDNLGTTGRAASFSHDNEVAKPYYYGVTFDEGSAASGVTLEVTPTDHAMVGRITFPSASENRNLVFDCERADGGLTINDDGSFTAYSDHTSNGSTRMYVYGQLIGNYDYDSKKLSGKSGVISFAEGTETVEFKISTSYISYDQAKKNMELEISSDDSFNSIRADAQQTWDDTLGEIEIEGATQDQLVTFYSSMYRFNLYPSSYSENTGTASNPVMSYASPYQNGKVVQGQLYVNNGFWDTYRTTWSMYALLTPNEDTDLLNGIIQHYKDQGWIPRWIAPGGTNSMVGTSSDVILGDAAQKGITFDYQAAYEASIKNASVVSSNLTNGGRSGLTTSTFLGYLSLDHDSAFSWSMEGYINDYGISQLAEKLGYTDEAYYYRNRSQYYINLFNDTLGWFMGKDSSGNFRTNSTSFNPANWGWGGDYTETNAWNMAFSVVQDGQGLANLYGGRAAMEEKLDALFNDDVTNTKTGTIHEMKEAREVRMGQYGHSNQPSHHLAYMYDYAGVPYKTAETVREILAHCYAGSSIGQGYIGDEDNGEMSAWYVFSALGFYPVSMGNAEYAIGSPLFTKATVHMDNGNTLVINAPNNSSENIYVQGVKLNGEDYDKAYFTHADLAAGGTIDFDMGSTPSTWGMSTDSLPTSITQGAEVADPAVDVTKGITIKSSRLLGLTTEQLVGDSAYQNLFDDTSGTSVSLTGDTTTFQYYNPNGKSISGYTITTASDPTTAPTGYTLSASSDGNTWVDLDVRTDQSFEWGQYTKPYEVDSSKQAVYKFYRLTITGSGTLSEIELLGTDDVLSEGTAVDEQSLATAVDQQISALGEITSVSQKSNVEAARSAYEALERSTRLLVTNLSVLESAEAKIDELTNTVVKGDVDGDGQVTVSDVVELRDVIMKGTATAVQLQAADFNSSGDLTVSDVVDLRDYIMKQG